MPLLLLGLVAEYSPAQARSNTYSVSGEVLDNEGHSLPEAEVFVIRLDQKAYQKEKMRLSASWPERILSRRAPRFPRPPPPDWKRLLNESSGKVTRRKTKMDSRGRFQVKELTSGAYRIVATYPGYCACVRVIWLSDEQPHHKLNLEVTPGCTHLGHLKTDDGKPVEGARIWTLTMGEESAIKSDSRGFFPLRGMADVGEYVHVTAKDHPPASYFIGPDRVTQLHAVEITLTTPRNVSGMVIKDGAPVRGAEIVVDGRVKTSSDSRGRFVIEKVAWETVSIKAQTEGYASACSILNLQSDPLENIQLELVPNGSLRVTVTDEDGKPVGNAAVKAFRLRSGESWKATTNANGVATIESLSVGKIHVMAEAPGRLREGAHEAEIKSGQTVWSKLALVQGFEHSVRVRLANGDPAPPGIAVILKGAPVGRKYTGRDGTARFELVPAGQYKIVTRHNKFLEGTGETEVPGPPAEVQLPRAGSISGQVLDERHRPVKRVTIIAERDRDNPSRLSAWRKQTTQTDSNGRFILEPLEFGKWQIRTDSLRYHPTSPIFAETGERKLSIRVVSKVNIRGRVVDSRGKPVPMALVFIQTLEGKRLSDNSIRTDQKARFHIPDLKPGCYLLRAGTLFLQDKAVRACTGSRPIDLVFDKNPD